MIHSNLVGSRWILLILLLSFPSCGGPGEGSREKGSGEVSFLLNDSKVTTDVWTCAKFTSAGDVNITTNMHRDARTLLFNVGLPEVGNRVAFGGVTSGSYATFFTKFGDPTTLCEVKDGWIEFSEWDESGRVFSAQFELTATSPAGEALVISEGRIVGGRIGEDQLID